jgi:quercetin dioxygenase-like cupin family protein
VNQDFKDQLAANGVFIAHHFVGGLYAKETHIPAGKWLAQHEHEYEHLAALMSGTALVEVDGAEQEHSAPKMLTIAAGKVHKVTAVTDVVWACLHATALTDPDEIDAQTKLKEVA